MDSNINYSINRMKALMYARLGKESDNLPERIEATLDIKDGKSSCNLIEESCMLLKTIDLNDYILEIRKRIEDVESQSNSLKEAYRRHLYSNKDLSSVLACPGDNKVSTLQKEIEKLLGEYDSILKEILKKREELPIEAMLKEQEQR